LDPVTLNKARSFCFRRDTFEKEICPLDQVKERVGSLLQEIQKNLLVKAREMRESKTYVVQDETEFKRVMKESPGFIKTMWCGDEACEERIKTETGATIRCIPFEQEQLGDTCPFCSKPADKMVYFAKAY
jgi:prolyl-tRNA synthetase